MFPVSPSPRDRLMLMKLSKGVGVGQARLVWLGERAVTAVQPILVRRAQVVFSRPFQDHLELYREMLQLPAVRWDHPHQKTPLQVAVVSHLASREVISLRGLVKEVRGDKVHVPIRGEKKKRKLLALVSHQVIYTIAGMLP